MDTPNCTHYQISLAIKPEPMHPAFELYGGTIEVDCTVTVENHSPKPLDIVPFLLYRMLSVEQICDASGQELAFTQEVVSVSNLPRQQVNVLRVSLPRPLPAGASTRIRLAYQGPVCGYPEVWPYVQDHVSERYTLLRRDVLWFPVVGSLAGDAWDGAFNFELSVAVPDKDLVVVANGQTCEKTAYADGVCYRWSTTEPDSEPRLTVACAPFEQTAIASNISLYYLPEDKVGAQIVARAMNRTRELCTGWFGPLPSRSLHIVEIPGGYGSEASRHLILQVAGNFSASQEDDPKAYRGALIGAGHEMIHLWGVRSLEEHVSRFLDEGITHYIEAWLLRVEIGEEAYWERMASFRRTFASGGDTARSVPLAEAGRHREVREVISRGKGPWLVCVLHHLVGDDFFSVLGAFLSRHRDRGATLEDLEAAFSQAAKEDLSRFFQEWLWGAESSAYLAHDVSEEKLVRSLVERYG